MTQAEARDRLRCWNRVSRWRRVSKLPVPLKWLVYGETPRSIGEIVSITWTAVMPSFREQSSATWAESAFLRELERKS